MMGKMVLIKVKVVFIKGKVVLLNVTYMYHGRVVLES